MMIEQTVKFLRNVWFRVYFYLLPVQVKSKKERYGLMSSMETPEVPMLAQFEEKIWKITTNLKFRPRRSISKYQKYFVVE